MAKFPDGEICRYDGTLHPLVASLPHYGKVPTDMDEQIAFRLKVRKAAEGNKALQKELATACAEDPLFFINVFCVTGDTQVVTKAGVKAIVDVTPEDLVWDGSTWVPQRGIIERGKKPVISAYGIRCTPDHEVMTTNGWQRADKGYDREKVRLPDGYRVRREVQENEAGGVEVPVRLRPRDGGRWQSVANGNDSKLWVLEKRSSRKSNAREDRNFSVSSLAKYASSVLQPERSRLCKLRSSWREGLRKVAEVREFLFGYGRSGSRAYSGSHRQRWGLRTGELPLGNYEGASSEPKGATRVLRSSSRNALGEFADQRGCLEGWTNSTWDEVPAEGLAEVEMVYDLANCGPNHCFTVIDESGEPLLVHNCYILEPREGEESSGMIPFNTWEHQDPVIASIAFYYGKRNIIGDKSRAQGASWIMCALFVWAFLFKPNCILGLGSKDESTADDADNPESLGWKIDFLLSMLPSWMCPVFERKASKHTWHNTENGAYIKAYAATVGIGRGGRYTWFFLDESAFFPMGSDREAVANLIETTNGLVMLSTPHGMDNEHYDRVHEPGPWLRVILDWKDNPLQNRGLYQGVNGGLQILDKTYSFDDGYGFNLDGRIRSPWYDDKCAAHGGNMLYIAQELDREYSGSMGRPFSKNILERGLQLCIPPIHTGMIFYQDGEPWYTEGVTWVEGEGYKFDLWQPLEENGFLPENDFVMGMDLSAGVGGEQSSNSVMSIFTKDTREQVGEFAINTIPPVEFAQLAVAVAYWLGRGKPRCHMIWEKQGPGIPFTKEIIRLGYPNVFYQNEGDDLRRFAKKSDRPGYHNSNRMLVLAPLVSALTNGDTTFRSRAMLEEAGMYVFDQAGKPHHPRSKTARDGSAKGENHGDRAMAAGLACMALGAKRVGRIERENRTIVPRHGKYSIVEQMKKINAQSPNEGNCRW